MSGLCFCFGQLSEIVNKNSCQKNKFFLPKYLHMSFFCSTFALDFALKRKYELFIAYYGNIHYQT